MSRINFNKDLKLHFACSTDNLRMSMQYLYIKDGYMYATNAHLLIKCKIEEMSSLGFEDIEKLDGKLIHKDNFKNILASDMINVEDDGITAIKGGGGCFYYFGDEKYPDVEKLIREIEYSENIETEFFSISLEQINNLYKSLPILKSIPVRFISKNNSFLIKTEEFDLTVVVMKNKF